MHTKIVYTLLSNEQDIYAEQFIVSAWSARYYNPDATIILICDDETKHYIERKYRKTLSVIVDDIISVLVPEQMGKKEKSRWLKTNARSYVDGSMIQVDTDTVICSNLSEIDSFGSDLAAVYDYHCELERAPYKESVLASVSKQYNISIKQIQLSESNYFNSGVIFSKETDKAIKFYNEWHEFWKQGLKDGVFRDQIAFYRASIDNHVDCLDGAYNCMIRASIAYLHTAKIVHFFNSGWGSDLISPFFSKDIYKRVKDSGYISEADKALILNCKSEFVSPSIVMDEHESEVIFSPVFMLLRTWNDEKSVMFRLANYIARAILKIKGL